jgi:hypothetical protein
MLLGTWLAHEANPMGAAHKCQRIISPAEWLAATIPATVMQCGGQIVGFGRLGSLITLTTKIARRHDLAHDVIHVNGRLSFVTDVAKHIVMCAA